MFHFDELRQLRSEINDFGRHRGRRPHSRHPVRRRTGGIDEESLRTLIDFNIAAGVHGLGVALGCEVFKFNEAERAQITRVVVAAVNERVPVIINSGAAGHGPCGPLRQWPPRRPAPMR